VVIATYRLLLRNQALLWLWGGQAVSATGDVFFNVAAMWVVYAQSGSTLQTAVIQAIWHLPSVLVGPFAGVLADRWDRKKILAGANALAAVVVGALAALLTAQGRISSLAVFVAVFLLNSLNACLNPARASLMPNVVGRDLLATSAGIYAATRQAATFLGSALAGVVIAAAGAAWALALDAVSFVFAALSVAVAPLPTRTSTHTSNGQRLSLIRDIVDGWRAIGDQPVVRAMVWLSLLINAASFTGPLYPALVSRRLHGGAATYGALEAVAIAGIAAGGALAGVVERRFGAGRVLVAGWGIAGLTSLGIAISTALPLTAALVSVQAGAFTVGGVSMGALNQALIPEGYRGRVGGITGGIAVFAIPLSALLGGAFADRLGPAPLFAIAGIWILAIAALAWANRHVRAARIVGA
jgi:MFS family permease